MYSMKFSLKRPANLSKLASKASGSFQPALGLSKSSGTPLTAFGYLDDVENVIILMIELN